MTSGRGGYTAAVAGALDWPPGSEQAADESAIFVSSTVRNLLLGGDARFEDRGEHSLKRFDSPWRLYALAD